MILQGTADHMEIFLKADASHTHVCAGKGHVALHSGLHATLVYAAEKWLQ